MIRFDHDVAGQCQECGSLSSTMICSSCAKDVDCDPPRETDHLEIANTRIIHVKPTFGVYAFQTEGKIWNERHYAGHRKTDHYQLKIDKVIYAGVDIIGKDGQRYADVQNHASQYPIYRSCYLSSNTQVDWDFKRKDYYMKSIRTQITSWMKENGFLEDKIVNHYYDEKNNFQETEVVEDNLPSSEVLDRIVIPIRLDMRYLALYFDLDSDPTDIHYTCLMARPVMYGVHSSPIREWEFDNFYARKERIMNKRVNETRQIS